jgi:Protein of unknown function (DUF2786)
MSNENDTARERMITRIRSLMAKTVANGCTEAEAKAAADHVDRLLALYELDLTEVTIKEQEVVKFEIKLDHHPVRYAAMKVAAFTDCMVWAEKGFVVFIGLEVDTNVAEYLMLMFQRAIDRESGSFAFLNPDLAEKSGAQQRASTASFSHGMAVRLGERLVGLKSKRDFTQKATGFDLVVAKGALVEEAFASLGINLTKGSGAPVGDRAAYQAGRDRADSVAINQGVGGRAASAERIR